MSPIVEARLVTRRDDATVALFLSWFAAGFLLVILADDVSTVHRIPFVGPWATVAVALATLGGAVFPWLTFRSAGERIEVGFEEAGVVKLGEIRIAASEVTGLSIANAERGVSLAIACGKRRLVFLEVERMADAQRIAKALGVEARWFGTLSLPETSRFLAALQALFAVALAVAAPLYLLGAFGVLSDFAKPTFGVAGVVGTLLATMLLTVRRMVPNQALALRRAAWDRHVALHESAGQFAREGEPLRSTADDAEAPASVALARGDEPLTVWLARLDALPSERGAYRGDALKRDVLWETLGDARAPADTRIAAARLLKRRHAEDDAALVRIVDDPDVRVRVEAAIDDDLDDEHVASELRRLGPIFRAR